MNIFGFQRRTVFFYICWTTVRAANRKDPSRGEATGDQRDHGGQHSNMRGLVDGRFRNVLWSAVGHVFKLGNTKTLKMKANQRSFEYIKSFDL